MSAYIRRNIAKMVLKSLNKKGKTVVPDMKFTGKSLEDIMMSCIECKNVTKRTSIDESQFILNLSTIEKKIPGFCSQFLTDIQGDKQDSFPTPDIEKIKEHIHFKFKPCQLSSVILKKVLSEGETYGYQDIVSDKQAIIVEYSSPNIAKPFHAGHLRSTIIGNFIANLYEAVGHKVIRINYLGDWGTQYGLLAQGYKKYGNKEELQKDPMKHLFMVYVKINEDMEKENKNTESNRIKSGETHKRSLEIFRNMENGNSEELELWKQFRDLSIEKYKEVYERLNIKFTEYEGESMYSKKSLELIEQLKERGLLHIDDDTGQGYIGIKNTVGETIKTVIQKSDGTTLYLTRDVAAILDRYSRYKFDRIHYVVENGQELHFTMLSRILQMLDVRWIDRIKDHIHIKFGRISNISTRKGTAVFLEDILDEAKDRMIKTIKSKETSKEVDCIETVADVLGVSSIIIQDLKEKRQNTYKFRWDKVLSFKGESGVVLQYAHARLCSLFDQCGLDVTPTEFNCEYLTEPEAIQLVLHIARYEEAIIKVLSSLEACHLVHYLFNLRTFISAAHRTLKVKDQPVELAQARLQVFKCAKMTLANGMKLLGITPLDKM